MLNDASSLIALGAFGSDPGSLSAEVYLPHSFKKNGPLVVVLHGSTQSAASYDAGSGWSALADDLGITLLFPGQRRTNNPLGSFNWFKQSDNHRGGGEPMSIAQMIRLVANEHSIDPTRIFITGMSSGGAMTSVMLATYPELFAGGAIIAGLPYRSANSLVQALCRMRGFGGPSDRKLERLVRDATDFDGPWPIISVWHGDNDKTVASSNARAIVHQWRKIHQAKALSMESSQGPGSTRRVWSDQSGRDVIEEIIVHGMGHGTPLGTAGKEGLGKEGKYMLEVGISSTRRIAEFWGLARA
ncbi:extracellular catalytic domain type 1 short-chain-length polyhydroxyalkanoate depolymerase [Falsirhodobacter xinxiangensis]|uniref:extracellular catalytic domain type 1 short-chain-length polyhydroxyalkanoate depolymerase n=1 Tax=Falsirhodobacter xinxiangensis TaxID=2530049 RepID=UPI0010AB2A78|nr:PHB depolymerase family esterase [Rhodobacter xinxiangensis]